jgi:hypothetical protein
MGFPLLLAAMCVTALAQPPDSSAILTVLYNPNVQTTPETLRTWTIRELQKRPRQGNISLKQILEESSNHLNDLKLSEVDLFNFYDVNGQILARVPRFLIWKDRVRLRLDRKTNTLYSRVLPTEGQLVPFQELSVASLSRVEMVNSWKQYPGVRLRLRTNPAAVRGEKLVTHNCLSCHSLPKNPPLPFASACALKRPELNAKHGDRWIYALDEYAHRGFQAYCEAASLSAQVSGKLNAQ